MLNNRHFLVFLLMLQIHSHPLDEKLTLEAGYRNSPKPYFRDRYQCILLSSEGFSATDLSLIYRTLTRTIYTWIHRYESDGFLGLKIQSGRGSKSAIKDLSEAQIEDIKAQVLLNPLRLRDISSILSEKFGFLI